MQLSIEVKIDEGLAMKVAEHLGMEMFVIESPEAPSRPVTFEEVDVWLEARMKDALVKEFACAIKAITMKEAVEKHEAELKSMEGKIDALVNKAVKLGGV